MAFGGSLKGPKGPKSQQKRKARGASSSSFPLSSSSTFSNRLLAVGPFPFIHLLLSVLLVLVSIFLFVIQSLCSRCCPSFFVLLLCLILCVFVSSSSSSSSCSLRFFLFFLFLFFVFIYLLSSFWFGLLRFCGFLLCLFSLCVCGFSPFSSSYSYYYSYASSYLSIF